MEKSTEMMMRSLMSGCRRNERPITLPWGDLVFLDPDDLNEVRMDTTQKLFGKRKWFVSVFYRVGIERRWNLSSKESAEQLRDLLIEALFPGIKNGEENG